MAYGSMCASELVGYVRGQGIVYGCGRTVGKWVYGYGGGVWWVGEMDAMGHEKRWPVRLHIRP